MRRILLSVGVSFLLISSFTAVLGQVRSPRSVVQAEERLNSPLRETNIALAANGRTIYFTSNRGGLDRNQEDTDIYYSIRVDSLGDWSPAIPLPPSINDELNQDEVFLSVDGQTLTFQCWSNDWEVERGPYYEMNWRGNQDWEDRKPVKGVITDFFIQTNNKATDGMARLQDGSMIFAAGPSFTGKMDLYFSKYDPSLGLLWPQPLTCNTPEDERSVFISGDGQTVYFSSDRPGGSGGLDIYRTVIREDGEVEEPKNIGTMVNTDRDELGFVMYSANEAFFIRDGDIFRWKYPDFNVAPLCPIDKKPKKRTSPPSDLPVKKAEKVKKQPEPATPDNKKPTKPTETITDQDVETPPVFVIPNTKPIETPPKPKPVDPLGRGNSAVVPVAQVIPEPKVPETGPEKSNVEYEPNNVVFMFDVSNPMNYPEKLPLMTGALRKAVPKFYRRDRISILSFSENTSLVLNGCSGDQGKTINMAITGLTTNKFPAGKPLLDEGLRCVETYHNPNGQNIMLWITDDRLSFTQIRPIAKEIERKKVKLILLIYGAPNDRVERKAKDMIKISGGEYKWINADNVDHTLEEILKLQVRDR